jgi:hypothetical protein
MQVRTATLLPATPGSTRLILSGHADDFLTSPYLFSTAHTFLSGLAVRTITSEYICASCNMDLLSPTTMYTTAALILALGVAYILSQETGLVKWVQKKNYQYEVTFSLYMLTPTEKFVFSRSRALL